MAPIIDAVIGLGGNLGDPRPGFRRALLRLGQVGKLVGVSSLYQTAPVGGPPQPDYLNAAARLRTPLSPRALLGELLAIERMEGRQRLERHGPRTLDLDLLWIDGLVVKEPGLVVPHPRLLERAFALRPLLEVAPEATDPRSSMPLWQVLGLLGSQRVTRLPGAWASPGMDTGPW